MTDRATKGHITRTFLDLQRPGLESTADYLLKRFAEGDRCDLSGVVIVVPGRRAGRRLVELLVAESKLRSLFLAPPAIETVGRVAELLYTPKREFANDLTQQLAWAEELRAASPSTINHLLPARPADDSPQWLDLAGVLRRQHIELAADGLDFHSVSHQVQGVEGDVERLRWTAMARLQDAYHRRLDELGLWDRQTARLKAIDFRECSTAKSIVLVGTVDMNAALKKMLDQIADQVTSLIIAPLTWSDRFDEYGALIGDRWHDLDLGIDDSQIEVVDRPRDQVAATVRHLAQYDGRYHIGEISIGVPNEQLVNEMERQLTEAGIASRWGPGKSLRESAPYRMLAKIADLLTGQRFADLADLLRHPDIEGWLAARGTDPYFTELDTYSASHLPFRVPKKWLGRRQAALSAACGSVTELLSPFAQATRPIAEWRAPLTDLLASIYEHRQFDQQIQGDRFTFRACQRFVEALDEQGTIPDVLMPSVSASEAIQLALDVVSRDQVPAEASDSIELLGWLELPLDDAPALIVTGVNEGFVPGSVNSDLFLPNRLRAKLGLLDNHRRYARDAYALTVVCATRQSVHLIVGRRTLEGDPLLPSRLLFATTPETVARRARHFFSAASEDEKPRTADATADSNTASLVVPRPVAAEDPSRELRVTAFRDYLACPYRFYLRHVLRLSVLNDDADELDGAAFGVAAHEVLRRFGKSALCSSSDPSAIRRHLRQELDRYASDVYGPNAMPAVRVQLEQLRLRLDAFASWQADHASQGWEIEYVESGETQSVGLDVDGEPTVLRGRIDRIDRHPDQGRVIIDYKTSDTAKTPDKAHRQGNLWVDLQLPLYRHLAAALDLDGPFELAYVLLPRDTQKVGMVTANWSESQLDDADDVARDVIRSIRRQDFWPPAQPPPEFSSDFAPICQDGVMGVLDDSSGT